MQKLGHDSVFDVFIAPDPTHLNSFAEIMNMFRILVTDNKRLAGDELS